jgi:hypothetical protein
MLREHLSFIGNRGNTAMRHAILLAASAFLLGTAPASVAQEEGAGWKKQCRQKAIEAGVWTKEKGRSGHMFNKLLKEERREFMRKCKRQMV